MAQLSRAVAGLRVMGDDLVPDEVGALLGATPTTAYARGDEVTSQHGVARVARSGHWSYEGPDTEPGNIDIQVTELLRRLTSDLDVWRGLADRFDIDLFCGWFMEHVNEGIEISAETLKALGDRHIVLSLDIYGGDADGV